MKEKTSRISVYAMAIAELIVYAEDQEDSLIYEKFKALRKTWSLLELYGDEGFDEKILNIIMEKKAKMILSAKTIQDVRELGAPPKVYYNGRGWTTTKNSVPEEEMIWWSRVSLKAPLSQEAAERYMELFKDFYGKEIDEFIAEDE